MSDNQDHRHHGHSTKDMPSDQQCSMLTSKALDLLGYNQDMVKYRVSYVKTIDDITDNKIGPNRRLDTLSAGSRSEGVVRFFESDKDEMYVYREIVCTDTPFSVIGDRNICIFLLTVNHDTAPGYTKLKKIKIGPLYTYLHKSLLLSECGDIYMSSDFFTTTFMGIFNRLNRRHTSTIFTKAGPAIPLYHPLTPDFVHDVVYSFKCQCPALLRYWLRRPRLYNCPPRSIMYDITQMDAYVAPVGFKGSETYYLEWRICFTKAEIHLIHCLNDTQTKLYIVLKMISKHTLKAVCSEITSYIIKNIVLWMCEYFPSDLFIINKLGCLFIQALVFLKKCVTQNYLPSYMIPERNLFNGRIEPVQKLRLSEMLSCLIEEGPPAVIKRIDKICDAMLVIHRSPAMADDYQKMREQVEKLLLLLSERMGIYTLTGMSEEEIIQACANDDMTGSIAVNIAYLVLPEWRILKQSGVNVLKIRHLVDDKLKTFMW